MSIPLDYASRPTPGLLRRNPRGPVPWLALGGSVFIWIIPFAILGFILGIFVPVFLAPLLLAILVYLVYRAVMNIRQRNGGLIVNYLEIAVRLNLPLVPFLYAARRSESGRCARQLARVHTYLAAGRSDALSQAADVPDDVIARLASAESLGQVQSALAASVQDDRRSADDSAQVPDATLYRLYAVFMLFSMSAVTMFVMVFIVPKFRDIFKDFKTTLPPITEFVIGVSTWMTDDFGILSFLAMLALLALLLLILSAFATRTFLPFIPLPNIRYFLDWIAWRIPLAHALQRDRAMAETCALLAAATRAGIALPTAARHAIGLPVNGAFRQQLELFHRRLLAGDTPADAAQTARLPHLMIGLLAPASSHAPDPELFSFLERYYRNRFSRLQLALRGALGPALVLTLGILDGAIVVALFLPLVKLIQSVSGTADGGAL